MNATLLQFPSADEARRRARDRRIDKLVNHIEDILSGKREPESDAAARFIEALQKRIRRDKP